MSPAMTEDELVRALVRRYGLKPDRAREMVRDDQRRCSPAGEQAHVVRVGRPFAAARRSPAQWDVAVRVIDDYGESEAHGALIPPNGLELVVPIVPRTKKNGSKGAYFGIARKGSAYADYRDTFIAIVQPIVDALGLPLPVGEYNLAARFYVDKRGEQADRFGLEQALADILQLANVVTDDWQFRTGDGTRIIVGDERPRVEITITPIQKP